MITNFPNGVSSFGIPLLGSGDIFTTGKVFFVSSTSGNNGSNGKSPSKALATLANAAARCTANKGDIIVLMPGHAESISSSTSLTLSTAGVTVIGVGLGAARPTLTFTTAATATINVTANSVAFKNVLFVANFADIVAPFTLTTAKDFTLIDCAFRDTSAILNFLYIIDTNATSNAADGIRIEDCRRMGLGATNNTSIIKMDGTNDRLTVKRCFFKHAATTAAGFMQIATTKAVTNAWVEDNVFDLVGATGLTTGTLITTDVSTNSGMIRRNTIFSLDATSEILVTASSGFHFDENHSSAVADASGYVLPARDS